MKIDVLDKGHVELVDCMGDDLMVVNAARVSFDKQSHMICPCGGDPYEEGGCCSGPEASVLSEADRKLIHYLAKHNHWTPFAHPQIQLRIKAPISIRTQFFKHKQGFVENEVSRRYVQGDPEVYSPEWRGAPVDGAKQGSAGPIDLDIRARAQYADAVEKALHSYYELIAEGVAPEQARFVLPQGTYTEWIWTGSLAAFARFYNQRSDPHAQWEIRQYAEAIDKIIRPLFPVSWEALVGETKSSDN